MQDPVWKIIVRRQRRRRGRGGPITARAAYSFRLSPLHRDERAAPRPAKATPDSLPGPAGLRAIVCPATCLPPPDCGHRRGAAWRRKEGAPKVRPPPPLLAPLLCPLSAFLRGPPLPPFLSSRLHFSLVSLPLFFLVPPCVWHTFSDSISLCSALRSGASRTGTSSRFSPSLLWLQRFSGSWVLGSGDGGLSVLWKPRR